MGIRMGATAGSTTAAVTVTAAAFGWLLSGGLFAALSWFGRVPASFARLVVPETVAAASWHSVMPWPVVVPALSALTLMGLLTVLLRVAVPRPTAVGAGARAGLMSVWFSVVLASFLTSALWSAGSILAQWPPMRAASLFDGVGPAVLAGGYWGIVWGWVPALVWRFLAARTRDGRAGGDSGAAGVGGAAGVVVDGNQAGRRAAGGTVLTVTAVFAVLLVAAAPLSGAANRAAAAQLSPVPAPTPTTPPVVYGSPTVGPSFQAPEPRWCRSAQVKISLGEPDAATGHRGMPVRLVNTGRAPCVLNAYPDVAFDDTAGWAMDILPVHGGSFMTTDPGARSVTLPAGAAAQAFLGWNAMAGAGDTRVGTVLVAPFPGAARTSLPADLDVVNGGYVAVTAWSLAKPAA